MSTPSTPCPSDTRLLAFAEGLLEPTERDAVEAHLDTCQACREIVAVVAGDSAATSATVADLASGNADAPLLEGGSVGRYVVARPLGEGAMGAVFAAVDPQLGRTVAVKVLHERLVARPVLRERMVREARAMARLSHPNVVSVFDVGEADAGVFIVMEYVEGDVLDEWTRGRSWREVVARYLECAEGLAAAHRAGMVHRDFKPANVLVGRDARARVSDFGLAAAADVEALVDVAATAGDREHDPVQLTRTGAVLGTPAYMSPEQFDGKTATAASDQFAFCVALAEALFGRRPVEGNTYTALALNSRRAAEQLPANAAKIPAVLVELLRVGLAPDPESRHASMDVIATSLERLLGRRRGWLLYGAAGLGGIAAVTAIVVAGSQDPVSACQDADARLVEIYDEADRIGLLAHLGRAQTPSSEETVVRVDAQLQRFTEAWTSSRRGLCIAAERDNTATASDPDRVSCLESQLVELAAALSVLGDEETPLSRAVLVVAGLPRPSECADPAVRPPNISLPDAAAAQAEAATLDETVAKVAALFRAFQFETAAAQLELVWPRLEALDYPPLMASALYWRSALAAQIGSEAEERELAEEAYAYAIGHGLDDEAGIAANKLVQCYGIDLRDPQKATHWIRTSEGLAARSGSPAQRARFLKARGEFLIRQSKFEEGEDDVREMLQLYRRDSPDRPSAQLAAAYGMLGVSALRRRDFAAARTAYEQQLDHSAGFYGSSHPRLALPLIGLTQVAMADGDLEEAEVLLDTRDAVLEGTSWSTLANNVVSLRVRSDIAQARGDLDTALALAKQTVELMVASGQASDPALALKVGVTANVHSRRGEFLLALREQKRALSLCEGAAEVEPSCAGFAYHNMAEAEAALGREADALQHYLRAIEILAPVYGPDSPTMAYPRTGLGKVKLALGDSAGAREALRRALEALEDDDTQWAEAAFGLARALWASDGRGEAEEREAVELATRAHEIYGMLPGYEGEFQAVAYWLATL